MTQSVLSRRSILVGGAAAAGLSACTPAPTRLYTDHIFIQKELRRMYLLNRGVPVAAYKIDLGFAPTGHKERAGDGRTPEGSYRIDRRNPNSSFHLSVGIDYPNEQDLVRAEELGVDPGGDIFIHGQPTGKRPMSDPDWTAGCIAVQNPDIEQIYISVALGTPVTITA